MDRNPYAPPESKVEAAPEAGVPEERPPRGGCLTALLAVMLSANVLMTLANVARLFGNFGPPVQFAWLGPVLLVVGVINIVGLGAIWEWRRWGFYVVAASAGLVFLLNIGLGVNPLMAVIGLIGPGLIFMLLRPMWKHFR